MNGPLGPSASRHRSLGELKAYQTMQVQSMLGSSRVDEPLHAVIENRLNHTALNESNNSVLERNRALLQYIAILADSNKKNDKFNYEFVSSLLEGGADINIADQHGQSIFHEVARSWNTDVAKFLLERGGDVNKKDNFGRTPLHVAASVDFVEMTEFLLQNDADIDARTIGQFQAPIHFAAKNGAVRSLKMLLGYHANIDSVDYRQRTPLQVAAEWTRDKTAKVLIEEGAASCLLDSSGSSALSVLIDRLPHLALEALDQLHTSDIITMKESYFLNFLEASRKKIETKKTRTPLETAVVTRKYEVVTHPVMQRLIENKWKQFGRASTILDLGFYIIFNVMWTAMSMTTPKNGRDLYHPLNENIWRIILLVLIGTTIVYQVCLQIRATVKTIRSQKHWITWQTQKLQQDLQYCHPRWPQEEKALQQEIKRISKLQRFSGTDAWFYYDWVVLFVTLSAIAMHFVYFRVATDEMRDAYTRTLSVVNLLVWLRLLKNVRPFPGIGTLVIILGETSGDFINWAFLFFLLLVPFSASFWIIFGGVSTTPVQGYETGGRLLYTVFQMAVGDDFNFEGLADAEPVMSRILTAIYITAMAIVTLNLLIALLSDTFSRVYSNAVANTVMQRAIKVVEAERTLSKKKRMNYRRYMDTNCSPEVIKTVIDAGNHDDSSKGLEEFHDNLRTLKRVLDDRFAKVYGKNKTSDFDKIRQDVRHLEDRQKFLLQNLMYILELLKELPGDKVSLASSSFSRIGPSEQKNIIPGLTSVLKSKFTGDNETGGEETDSKKRHRRGKKWEGNKKERKQNHKKGKGRSKTPENSGAKNKKQDKLGSHQDVPYTSIVPYHHSGANSKEDEDESSYAFDNEVLHTNSISELSEWDELSVDSVSL